MPPETSRSGVRLELTGSQTNCRASSRVEDVEVEEDEEDEEEYVTRCPSRVQIGARLSPSLVRRPNIPVASSYV